MGRSLLKYLITCIIFSLLGIIILDYIILPNYVGYNNEHYLPDVRSEYREKAVYHLRALGYNTQEVLIPYSDANIPDVLNYLYLKESRHQGPERPSHPAPSLRYPLQSR